MKKPPVAPKPRLLAPQKPAPPPIAPKPEIHLPSLSPSVPKCGKPALAPKPCLDKISPKAVQSSLFINAGKAEGVPPSKNGDLSHYIIPPKSLHMGNCKSRGSEETSETTEYDVGKKSCPVDELGCNSAKDQVDLLRQDVQNHITAHSLDALSDAKEDTHAAVLVKDHIHTQPELHAATNETLQEEEQLAEQTLNTQCLTTDNSRTNVSVPSPPSKPLPVPQPRRPRRNVLLRQKVVMDYPAETETRPPADLQTQVTHSEDQHSLSSLANTSADTYTGSAHITDPTHNRDSTCNAPNGGSVHHMETACYSEPATDDMSVSIEEEEQQPPAPPPRQTSLLTKGSNSYKTSSSLDNLLTEHADSEPFDAELNEEEEEEDEEAYGDFARCPFTRSLPKQIRLNRSPQVPTVSKTSSAEESSPKIAPKKPQRHSLPASALLRKQNTPPQTPVAALPPVFGALPAPPNEKPSSWRITFSGIPLFGKQLSQGTGQSHTGDGKRRGSVLVKQRARSFSSADLLRVDSGGGMQKHRSLKKLLDVRVKLFPRLLRGGTSLDCTSTDAECDANTELTVAGEELTQHDGDGDCGVEYENVPLYEEIPEYMNLPWVYSKQSTDSEVYEVQEPYQMSR